MELGFLSLFFFCLFFLVDTKPVAVPLEYPFLQILSQKWWLQK